MDLRALRYFVETVRHNSFTLAADSLCVTQSTVSKMIRQLENEVGQPLLLREGRQLRLTDAGRLVFERAQQALGVMRELTRELGDLTTLARGELTVGLPPMANLLFSPAVKAFRERHPGISLSLKESGGQVIEQQVASGELEIGVTLLPADPALGLAARSFGRFPIHAVGMRGAPWAASPTVDLAALQAEPLVLLSDDFSLTRQLRGAFRAIGVAPRIVAQSSQWDFLVAMAAAGLGTTFMPAPLLDRLKLGGELAARPLTNTGIDWKVALVHTPGRYLSHAARAWQQVCEDVLATPAVS